MLNEKMVQLMYRECYRPIFGKALNEFRTIDVESMSSQTIMKFFLPCTSLYSLGVLYRAWVQQLFEIMSTAVDSIAKNRCAFCAKEHSLQNNNR